MAQIWDQNEEVNENEDLVITEHRDTDRPAVTPEDEQLVETTHDDPQETLDELGEDVSSSPEQRGELR